MAEVVLESGEEGVSPGQACVFYDGDRVLGGGWISATETVLDALPPNRPYGDSLRRGMSGNVTSYVSGREGCLPPVLCFCG